MDADDRSSNQLRKQGNIEADVGRVAVNDGIAAIEIDDIMSSRTLKGVR